MKIDNFAPDKSHGKLVLVQEPERRAYAFLPNQLPPSHVSNDPHWQLITQAEGKIGRLDATAGQLIDLSGLLVRPLQRGEAQSSNRIEGTYVLGRDLMLFEAGYTTEATAPHNDDRRDVLAYDEALRFGVERVDGGAPIDLSLILDLHRRLLDASARGRERGPGVTRERLVGIRRPVRFVPPPPDAIPRLLANLTEFLTHPSPELHWLVSAFVAHYQFEVIHPFEDGNGRLGRVLLALCCYKWNRLKTPCLYLSEFFDANRDDYYRLLYRVSSDGEWNEWLEFCLRGTIEQADKALARCERLLSLYRRYLDVARPVDASRLVERLFVIPFMKIRDAEEILGVTHKTAAVRLNRLVEKGILVVLEGKPRMYHAPEIMQIAYGDEFDSSTSPS